MNWKKIGTEDAGLAKEIERKKEDKEKAMDDEESSCKQKLIGNERLIGMRTCVMTKMMCK